MGLKDKVAKLDFSSLPGLSSATPLEDGSRPKTAPGQMMALAHDARSELLKENDRLRERSGKADELESQLRDALGELEHWSDAKATRLLDPETIIRSPFANRHALSLKGVDFETLKSDIREAGGNVQPIKVRPVQRAGGPPQFEIIYGHRRYEACRQLGFSVLAMVDNVDDQALFVEMDRENRARKDLSAWEQGSMYRRALERKLFPSNKKLAEAVGVDLSAVGKALMIADLPDEVVGAFSSPMDLQFRWAKPLSDAFRARPDAMKSRAKQLSSDGPRLSALEIFERLTALDGKGVEPFHPPKAISVEVAGKQAATITSKGKGRALVSFEGRVLSDSDFAVLADAVRRVLSSKK